MEPDDSESSVNRAPTSIIQSEEAGPPPQRPSLASPSTRPPSFSSQMDAVAAASALEASSKAPISRTRGAGRSQRARKLPSRLTDDSLLTDGLPGSALLPSVGGTLSIDEQISRDVVADAAPSATHVYSGNERASRLAGSSSKGVDAAGGDGASAGQPSASGRRAVGAIENSDRKVPRKRKRVEGRQYGRPPSRVGEQLAVAVPPPDIRTQAAHRDASVLRLRALRQQHAVASGESATAVASASECPPELRRELEQCRLCAAEMKTLARLKRMQLSLEEQIHFHQTTHKSLLTHLAADSLERVASAQSLLVSHSFSCGGSATPGPAPEKEKAAPDLASLNAMHSASPSFVAASLLCSSAAEWTTKRSGGPAAPSAPPATETSGASPRPSSTSVATTTLTSAVPSPKKKVGPAGAANLAPAVAPFSDTDEKLAAARLRTAGPSPQNQSTNARLDHKQPARHHDPASILGHHEREQSHSLTSASLVSQAAPSAAPSAAVYGRSAPLTAPVRSRQHATVNMSHSRATPGDARRPHLLAAKLATKNKRDGRANGFGSAFRDMFNEGLDLPQVSRFPVAESRGPATNAALPVQMLVLERAYERHALPDVFVREQLAMHLGMTPARVLEWFHSRRERASSGQPGDVPANVKVPDGLPGATSTRVLAAAEAAAAFSALMGVKKDIDAQLVSADRLIVAAIDTGREMAKAAQLTGLTVSDQEASWLSRKFDPAMPVATTTPVECAPAVATPPSTPVMDDGDAARLLLFANDNFGKK